MKKKSRRWLCMLTVVAVMTGMIQPVLPIRAQESGQEDSQRSGAVTVTTRAEFMAALEQHKSPIVVSKFISIGDEAEDNGSMKPVVIPANTLIQGSEEGQLCTRSPIQLEGDGVCFQNIKLTFESSTALNSVPHRELFLAGHSLTLDNVDTYLEGAPELGGLGGYEKELLPTVYAGGYAGTAVAGNASLTVKNSNDNTVFQAIYMGHEAGSDNKVPYRGNALLNLDNKASVREEIDTSLNSQAEINITGAVNSYVKAKDFRGNENTTLTLSQAFMDKAAVENVGNVVLKDKAHMAPAASTLQNVTLQNGSCIDFNVLRDVVISGNFTSTDSQAGERNILVLNQEGSLTISGNVTGTTQFQTGNYLFPGILISEKSYIVTEGSSTEQNFVLAQKNVDSGYELRYSNGAWTAYREPVDYREVGRIEILSAPSKVDLRKIAYGEDEIIPDENTYLEIKWYDSQGKAFDDSEVIDYYMFYEADYVIRIRTDYWESDSPDILDKTDWFQSVSLMASENNPGRYYLRAHEGAKPGNYTFLFCSDYFEGNLETVADVKELKSVVKAEWPVTFYDQDIEETEKPSEKPQEPENPEKPSEKPQEPENPEKPSAKPQEPVNPEKPSAKPQEPVNPEKPSAKPQEPVNSEKPSEQPQEPSKPEHKHVYQSAVTKKATCTEDGVRTYTCICGSRYTQKILASGHKYTNKRVPATLKKNGKVQKICSVCSAVKDIAVIERPGKILWDKTDFIYDGKTKKPSVTVKDKKGRKLKANTDYQVNYSKGRKNPGVYTATIKFRGNYSGSVTKTFTIRPKKTSLKKVIGKSKSMQVVWKKQTVQIDGYQIQYGTNERLKGKTVKVTIAKTNTGKKTISKLKGKKKYYVRIRTYKIVKVKGKSKKLYSDWSGRKMVRTKK